MALIVEKAIVTTDTISRRKTMLCHTCREQKNGPFTVGGDGKPMCADCANALGKPII